VFVASGSTGAGKVEQNTVGATNRILQSVTTVAPRQAERKTAGLTERAEKGKQRDACAVVGLECQ
jgi:hypothetical protein